jgi:formylglycine-generating enzyme required for sulfatase activity
MLLVGEEDMRHLLAALMSALLLALVVPPARALTERRVALVIGNNQYQYVDALKNAVPDAKAIDAALRARGFEVLSGYDLPRHAMNDLVDDFVARLSTGTVAVVFYSGHGVQVSGENYLVPTDLKADRESDLANDGLDLQRLIERMRQVNDGGFNLAIIDACRGNPFHAAGRSLGGRKGLAPTTASGAMIVYAAGENQEALDDLGPSDRDPNGLFTREFLKVIQSPGLPIREAIAQVKVAVAKAAATVGAKQTPAVYDEATGDFAFTPGDAAAPASAPPPAAGARAAPQAAIDKETLFWETIKDSKDAADFEQYLKQYPKGSFAGLARNRIDKLKQAQIPATSSPREAAVAAPPAPPRAARPPAAGQTFRDCADCPEMVSIPPGRFMMGTEAAETSRENVPADVAAWERPRHPVDAHVAFALGKYPVTREEYARFAQATSRGDGPGCSWRNAGFSQTGHDPVVCVSWDDAKAYVAWLSRTTGKRYRLPSEAEWEYAARAGTTTARWWGDKIGQNLANCTGCGSQWHKRTSPVGSFPANPFGLYDMLGNALQWVEDCWSKNYTGAPSDTSISLASGDCGRRVLRGGSWFNLPRLVRAGYRVGLVTGNRISHAGFRVARTE